jgi:hypothetical protein
MGERRPDAPRVLVLLAAFSQYSSLLDELPPVVLGPYGGVGLAGPRVPFIETNYYAPSMGASLLKQLFVSRDPASVDCLPSLKVRTNEWERRIGERPGFDVPRPINLDPGALDAAKFILASTKDHAHRLYLGEGIFGEITLQYRAKRWQPLPWTYPDFQRADVQAFLLEAREYYRRRAGEMEVPS